jgi:glycosyltransferase involved in cell wall biosynthesis
LIPKLSVIICSLNGATGVERCIRALSAQTISSQLEIIVSDDGSTDNTSEVAKTHGAIVIRNATNRGVSAARNSGVQAASAPILAFVDDDCEPEPQWAECVLDSYTDNIIAIGGALLAKGRVGAVLGYLLRHNPLEPQELTLAKSDKLSYRLYLYLQRQWSPRRQDGVRDIFSVASANMSVRRQEFLDVGGFDERFRFGSEDEDLCRRLRATFPAERLIFVPAARVSHYFNASLSDTLRRRRAYGRGSAQLYHKWPSVRPTFFPGPLLVLLMVALSVLIPLLAVVALILPYLLYPYGLRTAVVNMQARSLLDPYLQLAEEGSHDVGFISGLWRFRSLAPEQVPDAVMAGGLQRETELVPRS